MLDIDKRATDKRTIDMSISQAKKKKKKDYHRSTFRSLDRFRFTYVRRFSRRETFETSYDFRETLWLKKLGGAPRVRHYAGRPN